METKIGSIVFGLVAWSAVLGPALAAAQQTVTMLDTGAVGEGVSLAVTPGGTAFVAYYDRTHGDLKLARCLDAGCTAAVLTTLDSAGDVGEGADLTIGADGRAVVSYGDRTNASVKIAHCDDASCTTATTRVVDPTDMAWTSIVTGSDGLPLVAYRAAGRLKAVHCSVADCSAWTVSDLGATFLDPPALAIASDGLGLLEQGGLFFYQRFHHCVDVACSAATLDAPSALTPESLTGFSSPKLARLGDGRLIRTVFVTQTDISGQYSYLLFARCDDATCFSQAALETRPLAGPQTATSSLPDGRGLVAYREGGQVRVRSCTNADCTAWTESCTIGSTYEFEVAAAADGAPLLAFHRDGGGVGVVHAPSEVCGVVTASVHDTIAFEPEGQLTFVIRLTAPAQGNETVVYQTADGTAQAGVDYVATSGVLTFAPGQSMAVVTVPLLSDVLTEPDETLVLDIPVAGNVVIGDGHGVGTIRDGAPVPQISTGDCQTVEGDAGFQGCVFTVTLGPIPGSGVTVAYQTADGSAVAGSDYVATSGILTFAPGSTSATISVPVIGDTATELDEVFLIHLSNPANALILDGDGTGGITDDDAASLSSIELTHGGRVTADVAALPGPLADTDYYRVAQAPFSSYEAVVDAVSGDAAPGLALDLLAEDNTTVLAHSEPAGTGSAAALRWVRLAGTETRGAVRVGSASCGTACGPDDSYRLRFYDTTASIPRFNNTASQVTVLVLQNASAAVQNVWIMFWGADGTLLRSEPRSLGAHQTLVVNAATFSELSGQSGSITIAGFGGYGALVGKAVALEPATGFSFDSPLGYKPR